MLPKTSFYSVKLKQNAKSRLNQTNLHQMHSDEVQLKYTSNLNSDLHSICI